MSRESFLYPSEWLDEQSTWYYSRTITDELGAALGSASITTLTLTWYELDSGTDAIVNNINGMDVKAANNGIGTISSVGKFEMRLRPADTIILGTDATKTYERRRALLVWTFGSGGSKTMRHEIDVAIRKLSKVG
jgi:hypothetical protein